MAQEIVPYNNYWYCCLKQAWAECTVVPYAMCCITVQQPVWLVLCMHDSWQCSHLAQSVALVLGFWQCLAVAMPVIAVLCASVV